ncbi:hypothetical protein ABID21_001831 [Pseudorhizobium tarimense]|uniref:Uncharacterized protein n=1 Tax=Pseudorhizobium tarimense TaxID=1079109 RepID=A0ABV2H5M9_9HYPH
MLQAEHVTAPFFITPTYKLPVLEDVRITLEIDVLLKRGMAMHNLMLHGRFIRPAN